MMTKDEAHAFRAGHDTEAKVLSRMPKYELVAIATMERAAAGFERLYGTSSKDELVAEILDLRGFGVARLNEAIHVLHHNPAWPDCERCQDEAECLACIGRECHCDHPARPLAAPAFVPTGIGWPVGS